MKQVLHFVLNDLSHDIRVLKETKTLNTHGYKIQILALKTDNKTLKENVEGIPVKYIQLTSKVLPAKIYFQFFKYLELILHTLPICLKYDIIHCHDFEPLPIALLAKMLKIGRLKVIYDSHELQSERSIKVNPLRKKLFQFLEYNLIRFSNKMITVNRSIAQVYKQRTGIAPIEILNCPFWQIVPSQNIWREKYRIKDDQLIFIYQGLFSPGRGIESLISAFLTLPEKFTLILMGKGHLEVKIKEKIRNCNHIFVHGFVPQEELLNYTASADFGIIPTEMNSLNNQLSLPNKFFEYAMAKLPIVSIDSIEMSSLIKEYQCGMTFKNNEPLEIQKTIKQIVSLDRLKLRDNAQRLAKAYCWEIQEIKLLEIYKNL